MRRPLPPLFCRCADMVAIAWASLSQVDRVRVGERRGVRHNW
jgi:hypothetical protein